jgi:hypothetical protein
MSLAATIPTLGVGEQGRAGCISLLLVLVALERVALDATGKPRSRQFRLAVGNEDEPWCEVGTMPRYHGGDDDTVSREVAKSSEPTSAIVLECIPFEKGRVEKCMRNK